ncbi:MAG: hypothetical protein AAGA67_11350 [Cyanobacteria bacterium P01_F01_bin.153]
METREGLVADKPLRLADGYVNNVPIFKQYLGELDDGKKGTSLIRTP